MNLRRCFLALVALAAFSPPVVLAQSKSTGSIPSTGGGTACVTIGATAQATVAIQVTGTWTGTLQPEISVQGQAPANIQVTPSTSSTPASTITANGIYRTSVAGGTTFLVCGNTVASGTAVLYLNASVASSGLSSGGGGGGGTVTSVTGSAPIASSGGNTPDISCATCTTAAAALTANGVVVGAGGQAEAVSTVLTDNGTTATYTGTGGILSTTSGGLKAGVNGGAAGVLSLNGSTSGTSTLTAPAIAGTSTNPITSSNIFQGPDGTSTVPAYSFTGLTTGGMFRTGSSVVVQQAANNGSITLSGGAITLTDGNAGTALATASGTVSTTTRALQLKGATDFAGLDSGQLLKINSAGESITLNTGGTTTDSTNNLLPANSIILAVTARITTTITTAANWSLGDGTTAARFMAANSTLTSGTTAVGMQGMQGSVSTDAAGPVQAAAAKLRITTNVNPGAGVIRVTVYYLSFTPPTS